MEKEVGNKHTTVDVLDWLSRTALELVGQGGLGYGLDNLDHNGLSEYGKAVSALE